MRGKKRVIRLHRVVSMFVAIVATIVIAVVVYEKSGLLSYQLSNYVNDHYLKNTNFRFSCGRISLDFAGRASLARPVLRYTDGQRFFELFRARRIAFRCDLLQVLKLRAIITDLEIEEPTLVLQKDESGGYLLPMPTPVEERPVSSSVAPHVEVASFDLSDLSVAFRQGKNTLTVHDVKLVGQLSWVNREGTLEITEGHGVIEERSIPIDAFTLKVRTEAGAIVVDRMELRTPRSYAIVSGRHSEGRLQHVQAIFNPLDLGDVSATGLIDEAGELGGNLVVEGNMDSLSVHGSVTGKALGLAFDGVSFEGVVTDEQVYLSNVQGGIYGARLNGDLTYRIDVGNYAFHGVCEGLDISQGFVPGGGLPETDLNGLVNVEYDAAQKAYEFRGDLRRSVVDGFLAESAQFRIGYREVSGVRFREVTLAQPGFEVQASGLIDADENVDMIIELEGDTLAYIAQYFGLPEIAGHAHLSGRLAGPIDDLQLNLNGDWNDLTWEFVCVDSARVSAEARNLPGENAQATINVEGPGLSLWGRRFEKPHALIEAAAQAITFRDISFARGDTFVTGSFEAVPDGEVTNVRLQHLLVQMPLTTWINDGEATLAFEGTRARIDSVSLVSNGQRIGIVGTYDSATRIAGFHGWGNRMDLALIREAVGWPLRLTGLATFEASVQGNIDDPAIDLHASIGEGVIDSLEFVRLDFDGRRREALYTVDRMNVVGANDSISLGGTWSFAASPVEIVRDGLDLDAAAKAPINAWLQSHHYALSSVFRLLRREEPVSGVFDGELTVENSLGSPRIRMAGALSALPEYRYRLPEVETEITYEDMKLSLHSVKFDDGNTSASVRGSLPVNIGLGRKIGLIGSGPVSIEAVVQSKDLTEVSNYFALVAVAGGRLQGNLRITGTSDEPHYDGMLDVERGVLRLGGMEELYEDVRAHVELKDRRLVLASLSGKSGEKGRFSGSGWANVEGFHLARYELNVDFTDFELASIQSIESIQNGRLSLASRQLKSGEVVPEITGQLDVTQALVTLEFGNIGGPPSPSTMPTETPSWLCNIDIDAPKNVWLRNRDLNMEMQGQLIVHRDQNGLFLRGELSPLRGSYLLYNNKFHVTGGRVDFSTGFELRPGLYLDAYTPHRRSGGEERRIYLNLNWPPDKPEPTITLSYDVPGYSQADLWRMLGGQVAVGGAQTATGAAQNIASSYLERILNAQMHETTIDVETRPRDDSESGVGGQALSVALGRYLSPDLYLKYRQGISYTTEREVEVEYRMSNIVLLRSEFLRHSAGITGSSRRQSTDEVNFDIKFRWEY